VHDEQERAAAGTRRLPAEARTALRERFADELAERLPRLRAAVGRDDDALLPSALRDAHSLGSSAAVMGLAEASRSARAVEALLASRRPGDPAGPELRSRVAELGEQLHGWRP